MENNNEQHPKMSSIPNGLSPDPLAPAENNSDLSKEIEEGEEIDLDEAVHSLKPTASEEEMQQDGDEAVHENYKPAPSHEGEEIDPDDAVHGKG